MSTGEGSAETDVCRPCPLSKLGCGSVAESDFDSESAACSPGVVGVAFVLPLVTAALGAGLAEALLGPEALEQLLGALAGLAAGVVVAASTLKLAKRWGGVR